MPPWIDPRENEREQWAGTPPVGDVERTVYERATATSTPYERSESLHLSGPSVQEAFDTATFDAANLSYHVGVDVRGAVKVLVKGHLWGGDDAHQRFRTQYRRPPEPTETVPFDEYLAWTRYQEGTVRRTGEGTLAFDPETTEADERTYDLSWDEMYPPDRVRLAEAELVRNPPLARYVLRERDRWAALRDVFRYDPDAFDRSP